MVILNDSILVEIEDDKDIKENSMKKIDSNRINVIQTDSEANQNLNVHISEDNIIDEVKNLIIHSKVVDNII